MNEKYTTETMTDSNGNQVYAAAEWNGERWHTYLIVNGIGAIDYDDFADTREDAIEQADDMLDWWMSNNV